ncbi:MAG: hypothetical protein K9M12_02420 [Candidatus Pacebacteria bacterium]|nr:hypothetical protein [Candidatus Paceibacterota bacterium]
MEKFKMFVVFLLILMFVVGAYFFIINFERKEKQEEVESSFSVTGNLIINNPGLDKDEWYLVYDKEGASGVTKKLVIQENDIACKGGEEECSVFFNFEDGVVGERVEVKGEEDGSEVIVYEIEFLED